MKSQFAKFSRIPSVIFGGIACVSLLLSSAAVASEPRMLSSGNGWQHIQEAIETESDSGVVTQQLRELIVVESLNGLEGAPLPDEIKNMIRPDFEEVEAHANGASVRNAAIFDLEVARAIANGTAESEYSSYLEMEPEDNPEGGDFQSNWFGCHTRWRYREWDAIGSQFSRKEVMDKVGANDQGSVTLSLNGEANGYVGYKYKKTSFCLPWVAWLTHIRTDGYFDVTDTSINLNLNVLTIRERWRQEFGKLFDINKMFFIGPIPVRVGVAMPFGVGLDYLLTVGATSGAAIPMTGTYRFDYTCTLDGCVETEGSQNNVSSLDFSEEFIDYGANISGYVRPYGWIEFDGYLYSMDIASVGIGLEAAVPISFSAGNESCGDLNADGITDSIDNSYVDINAELSLYFRYTLAGLSDYFGLDWGFDVKFLDIWTIYEVDEYSLHGNSNPLTLRKNLYFKYFDFSNWGGEYLSVAPIVSGEKKPGIEREYTYQVKANACYSLKDAITFGVWEGGRYFEVSEPSDAMRSKRTGYAEFPLTWTTPGDKEIKIQPLYDAAGRQFGGNYSKKTSTIYTVNARKEVPPPAVTSAWLPSYRKECSSTFYFCGESLRWNPSPNTEYYVIQKSVNGSYFGYSETKLNGGNYNSFYVDIRNIGNYKLRIKSCNEYGCSAWTNSNNMQVGDYPGQTYINVATEKCYGRNMLSWAPASDAKTYKLYSYDNTSGSGKRLEYSGTARSYYSNKTGPKYYRVQACNELGCGVLSSLAKAEYYNSCS